MTQLGEPVAIGLIDPATDPEGWEPEFDEAFQFVDWSGEPIGNVRYEIIRSDGSRTRGTTDAQGRIPREKSDIPLNLRIHFLGIGR